MKKTILIPGISGLLGLNLALTARGQWTVTGCTHEHPLKPVDPDISSFAFDLTQPCSGYRIVEMVKPDAVINCVAVANLEASEKEPGLAQRLNTALPSELAKACADMGIPMVHISTDAVFDGRKGNYTESDAVNPINTYARTKLAGEEVVAAANSKAIIARVNFYGWSLSGNRSLCEFFFNNLRDEKPLKGTTDLLYNPMLATDLASVLLEMMQKGLHGIYHVSVNDPLSKYEFGRRLAEEFGLNAGLIEPVSWKELSLRADRSPNLTLSVDKLIQALGHPLPNVADGLKRLHQQLDQGYAATLRSFGNGA